MKLVREISVVASVGLPIDERLCVRRCRYAAEGESRGRVCLASGIHGDEMMGQLIVYGVASRIVAEPEHLHGIVDVYPILNPLGLDVGERMMPSGILLDMNRGFPGRKEGTTLESLCYQVTQDMLGADLVLDIHASTRYKSEIYEVRINAPFARKLIPQAKALCPDLIWVYPDKTAYNSTLAYALCSAGTPAMTIEADERRRRPQEIAERIVDGIFCKLHEMGLWSGDVREVPAAVPCVRSSENAQRVTCEHPGVYVPEDNIGRWVKKGQLLGRIIDALAGEVLEEIVSPCEGLVFTQRSYSAVYPGTLIARLYRKEQKA